MNRKLAAQCLSELGNLTRLDIYRLLVRGGLEGMKISDIQARLGVPASTLAFHLGGLVGVGLVSQEKVGREVICRASTGSSRWMRCPAKPIPTGSLK